MQDGLIGMGGYNNNNTRPLTPKSMPPTNDEHAKLKAQAPNSKLKNKKGTAKP